MTRAALVLILSWSMSAFGQASCIGASHGAERYGCIRALLKCQELKWSACQQAKEKTADGELNEVYNFLLDVAPLSADTGPRQEEVRQAQRAWLRWRESLCQFEALSHAWSSEEAKDFFYRACKYELTLSRISYLKGYYNVLKERR